MMEQKDVMTDAEMERAAGAGAPEVMTDAEMELAAGAGAPEVMTDAEMERAAGADAPEVMTDAEMEALPGMKDESAGMGVAGIVPSFGEMSAGVANVGRGLARTGATLLDKGLAAKQLFYRGVIEPLSGFEPGEVSSVREEAGWQREAVQAWIDKMPYRDAEGRPTEEFWDTMGGELANSIGEVYALTAAGVAAGGARPRGAALAAGGAGAAFKALLKPSLATALYGASQAESTAGKAEEAGMGRSQQLGLGALTGAWEMAMEGLSQTVGLQATARAGDKLARAVWQRALNAVGEGAEEGAQSAGTGTVEKLGGLDARTWDEIGKGAAAEGLMGLLAGAAAEGGNFAAERSARRALLSLRRAAGLDEPGEERVRATAPEQAVPAAGLELQEEERGNEVGGVQEPQADGEQRPAAGNDEGGAAAAGAEAAPAGEAQGLSVLTAPTPEQERLADEAAAAAARQDYGAKKRTVGRSASDALWRTDPVRAAVIELGGLSVDGTEESAQIPAAYRAPAGRGQRPDQMLRELEAMPQVGERVSGWTVDDLTAHLQGSARAAAATARERPVGPEERAWLRSAWTVGTPSLGAGFTLSVRGVPYRVEAVDESGAALVRSDLDDGRVIRLDHGKLMNIDGGSLKNGAGRKVKPAAAPEAPVGAESAAAEDVPLDSLLDSWTPGTSPGGTMDGEDAGEDVPFRSDDRAQAREDRAGRALTAKGAETGAEVSQAQGGPLARANKPLRQVRVVKRGYDEERQAADDAAFSRWASHPMDLPELVELAEELTGGVTPKVMGRIGPAGKAAGAVKFGGARDGQGRAVFGRPQAVMLLASNYKLVSDEEAAEMRAAAEAAAKALHGEEQGPDGEPAWKAAAAEAFDAAYMAEVVERVKAGPRFAMTVIGHEIGHIADQAARYGQVKPDRSKGANRLNLLGRVAGLISWTRDVLADDPAGRTLSAQELRELQARARKSAKPEKRGAELMREIRAQWAVTPELRGLPTDAGLATLANAAAMRDALEYMARERPVLAEWFAITTWPEQVRATMDALKSMATSSTTKEQRRLGSAWFRQAFVAELEKRRQAHLGKMYSELESLIAWWNGGDRSMMDPYYERPAEMYAEAFGVYLNNPGAVKKRAPMFYRTLLDYMSARPEVEEALDELNERMARGPDAQMDAQERRVREMFGRDRRAKARQMDELANKGQTRRLAADAARYMLLRKSGPLHAVLKTADALGLGWLTDRVAQASDVVENVAALERMFAAELNEVGRILEDGGLDVVDFDTWAFLDMVARNPAYAQRANPRGMHPERARKQLDYLRVKMGDRKANTLERAVTKFQRIWQDSVVARLEGMYSEQTMRQLRENPVYFTLRVGMDDAELAEFDRALADMDEDRLAAFAARSVERGAFGDPVPGGIQKRVGTHRPAMSLFGATLLKGIRLINDQARNKLATGTRELLRTVDDPYFMDSPDGQTAQDTRTQSVVRYWDQGVKKAYYAPKYVGHYVRGDNPIDAANKIVDAVRTYTLVNVWKRLTTMWSPRFMLTQPISDAKTWNTLMPGARTPIGQMVRGNVAGGVAQMLPGATWYLPASVFPADSRERRMRAARDVMRKFYKTGEIDPALRSLIERGMYDLGGAFQGLNRTDPDAGEILTLFAGIKPSKALEVYATELNRFQKGWQKISAAPGIGKVFERAGRAFEAAQMNVMAEAGANKIAAMQYLDSRFPNMSERDKRRAVLEFAGNPNFAARAGADPIIDMTVWTFYNPNKEGYRSVIDAAKYDPAGFTARVMWYNILPNVLKWSAASGALVYVAEQIIPHGETPEDEEDRTRFMESLKTWAAWFRRMPQYYSRRYVSIPVAPVGNDSVLAVTIPQAQSLAPINGLVNVLLDEATQATGKAPADRKGVERAVTALTAEVQAFGYLSGQSRAALQQVLGPIIEMLTTDKTNVYDPFYGRYILDRNEEQLMAGGRYNWRAWPAWQKLGANAWNSAIGAAVGRFDTKTPRADQELKTALQKVLTSPGVAPFVGGMLRITGGGEFEKIEDMLSAENQNRAYDNIMVRKAALETLEDPQRRFPAWAADSYANDPLFRANWNEYIITHNIYSGMSVEDRMIYRRTNPRWQRMMLLREKMQREGDK